MYYSPFSRLTHIVNVLLTRKDEYPEFADRAIREITEYKIAELKRFTNARHFTYRKKPLRFKAGNSILERDIKHQIFLYNDEYRKQSFMGWL